VQVERLTTGNYGLNYDADPESIYQIGVSQLANFAGI
jgi:hypothetical protein